MKNGTSKWEDSDFVRRGHALRRAVLPVLFPAVNPSASAAGDNNARTNRPERPANRRAGQNSTRGTDAPKPCPRSDRSSPRSRRIR